MVKDLISHQLGGGEEKARTIVIGDLMKADKLVLLSHLAVESMQVEPSYFEDFITGTLPPGPSSSNTIV